ncbi:MAG: hypothetical protein ABSB53_03780 [Nitrososphaerales archaeon]
MGRRLLGIVVFLALFGVASAIMFLGGVPLADYLPDIVGGLIGASLLVLAWTFRPEIDHMARPRKAETPEVTEVKGKLEAGLSVKVTVAKPKKDWKKIAFTAYAGFLGSATLVYVGWKTYSLTPAPIPPSAFLPIITAIVGGVALAVFTVYFIIQILRP